jgi:hypothetical protein
MDVPLPRRSISIRRTTPTLRGLGTDLPSSSMPELPEVEVLVRHLDPLLRGKRVGGVAVGRAKIVRPETSATLADRLVGATFGATTRRAKYLLFELRQGKAADPLPAEQRIEVADEDFDFGQFRHATRR